MSLRERIKERTEHREEKKLGKERIRASETTRRATKERERALERRATARELEEARRVRGEAKYLQRESREIQHPSLKRVRQARTEAKQIAKTTYGEAKHFAGARIKETIKAERQIKKYGKQKAISEGRMGRSRYPRPSGRAPPIIRESRYGGQREITGLGYGIATEYAQEEKQLQDIKFWEHQDKDFFGAKKEYDLMGSGSSSQKIYDFIGGKKKKERYY